MTHKGVLLMEMGLLHDYFGIVPCIVKNITFVQRGACKVRLSPLKERLK